MIFAVIFTFGVTVLQTAYGYYYKGKKKFKQIKIWILTKHYIWLEFYQSARKEFDQFIKGGTKEAGIKNVK